MSSGNIQGFKIDEVRELQEAFNTYQHEFKTALERSAEVLRHTITIAQESISEQLTPGGADQSQENPAARLEAPLKQITSEIAGEAFARAKEILEAMEPFSKEEVIEEYVPQAQVTLPNYPPLPVAIDPLAATNVLVAQAKASLDAAVEAVIRSMSGGLGAPSPATDAGVSRNDRPLRPEVFTVND